MPRRSYFVCQMCHVFSALCSFRSICPKSPRCTASPPPASPHLRFLLPTFAVLQALALMFPPRITLPMAGERVLALPFASAALSTSLLLVLIKAPRHCPFSGVVLAFHSRLSLPLMLPAITSNTRCSSLLCSQGLTEFLLNRCTSE